MISNIFNKIIITSILTILFLALFSCSHIKEPKEPAEITDNRVVVFSDSEDNLYTIKFMELIDKEDYVVYINPKYFSEYSELKNIVLFGTPNTETADIIKKILGDEFDEEKSFSLVKEDVFSDEQSILIYFAQTDEELLDLLENSQKLEEKEPAESEAVAIMSVLEFDRPKITGAVIGCGAEMEIEFVNAIINGILTKENEDYVHLQVYDPIASSTLKDVALKPGNEGVKQAAEAVLQDLAGSALKKVHIYCADCGQSKDIQMKSTDYLLLENDINEWETWLSRDFCTSCPGSDVLISYDEIDTMEIYGMSVDLSQGTIGPNAVFDALLGKIADTYDNLPQSFSFVQVCPDYVPRIIVSFLLPVFKDMEGNIIEYSYNWKTMLPDINMSSVGSYSDPISFNPIFFASGLGVNMYLFYPEYRIYYTAKIKSSPPGFIEQQEGVYSGSFVLSAPPTVSKEGKEYVFNFWEINGVKQQEWQYIFYMDNQAFDAVAHYFETGYTEDIELIVYDNYFDVEKAEDDYIIDFRITNEGWDAVKKPFMYAVYVDNNFFMEEEYDYIIDSMDYADLTFSISEGELFYGGSDKQTVSVIADSTNVLLEKNETNNKGYVVIEKEKPDITIRGHNITITKEEGVYKIQFLVKNEGFVDVTEPFFITIYSNDVELGEIYYRDKLAAGAAIMMEREYDINKIFHSDEKEYYIEIFADSSGIIKEMLENNNKDGKTIKKSNPDLTIAEVNINPDDILKGETVVIGVVVENVGETASDSATLELYFGDTKLNTESIGPLEPGEDTTIVFSGVMNDCGTHTANLYITSIEPEDENPFNDNTPNNKIKVDCSDISCGSITNPYSCSGASCSSGICVWDSSLNRCSCSQTADDEETGDEEEEEETGGEVTCVDACGSHREMCFSGGQCYAENSYEASNGNKWCQTEYNYEGYVCCCIVE